MTIHSIRKIFAILLVVLIVLTSAAGGSTVCAETKSQPLPVIKGDAAIIYCNNTGEVVFEKNAETKYNPYGITKLMTALLAIQKLPLDKEVTVPAEAAKQGEPTMELKEGEKVSVEQLLYGTLMLSANDAAYTLAIETSGKTSKFIKKMNKTAKNIGCKSTVFNSVTGMEKNGQYTTAKDMAAIARVALDNPTIRKISGTTTYNMMPTNKHKKRYMKSTMDLITEEGSGITGGLTGNTGAYHCTVAGAFQQKGLELVVVILSDTRTERANDLRKLTKYAVSVVKGVRVIKEGKACGKVRIRQGAKTRLEAYNAETGYAYLPKEGAESLISTQTVMDTGIKAPVQKGDVVGTFRIYAGEEVVNEVPLVVHESVEKGWFPSYIGISNRVSLIILIVLVILFVLYSIVMFLRMKEKRRRRKIRQRKIMRMAEEEARKEAERQRRDWRF